MISQLCSLSSKMNLKRSIANQTGFALRLAGHVAKIAGADTNLAVSPLSFHLVLGMIAAGSRGATLDQLHSVVHAGGSGELNELSSQVVSHLLADASAIGGPRLAFSNGVFADPSLSLKPSFKEIVTSTYKAEFRVIDFQKKAAEVTGEVNSWVENTTSGLIKELLPAGSVDQYTRLVLCNALYFKGAWEKKFEASETKESKFHLLNGSSVQVPFMTTRAKQFLSKYHGFKVLRLLYEQGEDKRQFSMYIFLPDAQDGLWSLVERLSSEPGFLDRHRPWQKSKVGKFKLPRFKISFEFEASKVLKDLGLLLPFTADADLKEMVDSSVGSRFRVSLVFHKSVVEVNEEGTEAAAATAAMMIMDSGRFRDDNPVDFEADHPFVFLITEDTTGVVLFAGHVLNPLVAV